MHFLKKNIVLKVMGYLNLVMFLYFGCLLDIDSLIPLTICIATGTYLAVFGYANNWFEGWCK